MRRIAWLIIPVAIIALLAVAVFAARAPKATTAFTLSAGDCFDIPADDRVGDLPTTTCDQPHDAEVFVAAAMAVPGPGDSGVSSSAAPPPYPGPDGVAQWVAKTCDAAAREAYLGPGVPTNLVVGYFFPGSDAWTAGERHVTCYLHTADGSKLTGPLGNAQSAAPS